MYLVQPNLEDNSLESDKFDRVSRLHTIDERMLLQDIFDNYTRCTSHITSDDFGLGVLLLEEL